MSWKDFISSLVDSLAWPVSVVGLLLVFRRQLRGLLDGPIKRLRVGAFEVERWEGAAAYGRAAELLGQGRYGDASEELLTSTISRIGRNGASTELRFELRFMQADLAHLQNRYDDAAQMFKELGSAAAAHGDRALHARCVWARAHVLRHQGRALDQALRLFDEAVRLAEVAGDLYAKVYSVTGATGIKVFRQAIPDSEDQLLANVEAESATSGQGSYLLEVWKSQAQVAWAQGEQGHAREIIEAAIDKALASNHRLLYNAYFERAEFERFEGDAEAALKDYLRVLEFGNGNGDRNLISMALLGIVLVELSTGKWSHHNSREAARESVVRAQQLAQAADIGVTAQVAKQVRTTLDGDPAAGAQPPRLILF